jgi:preprotein translocase SecE subunit
MMTAVLAGVLVTAMAGWLWQQMAVVPLPTPRWALTVDNLDRAPAPGSPVEIEHESASGLENIGRAVVDPKHAGGGQLVVGSIALTGDRTMTEASRLKGVGSDGKDWTGRVTQYRAIPVVEPIYVQAGAATVVLVVGAFLIFRYVAVKAGSVEFLIATDAEMKKVNWSTRKMVIDSTWVVVGACVLLVVILFLLDIGFSRLFHMLDVLEG